MKTPSTLDKQSTAQSLDIIETINAIAKRAKFLDKQEADIETRKNEFAIHKAALNKYIESDQRFTQLLAKCDYKTHVKGKNWVDYAGETAVRNDITKSIK